jgi:hypothetical protein
MKVFNRAVLMLGLLLAVSLLLGACSGSSGNDAGLDGDGYNGGDEGPIACLEIGECPIHNLCLEGFCRMGTICKSHTDCPANFTCLILKEVCVPENPCSGDGDCAAPTPYCLSGSGVCVTCKENAHCEAGYECNESYECQIIGPDCTDDNDCADPKPHCDQAQGKCYPCVEDNHCSPMWCEPTSRQCVECYDNSHCTSGNPYCLTAAQTCVECRDDNDCSGGERCSVSYQCTDLICTSDNDCINEPGRPKCNDATGDCVQCLAHGDCSSYQWCRDFLCVTGCETDQECIDKNGADYHCDNDGSCYYAECTTDDDCSDTPETPACKTAATPSSPPQYSCVGCTNDDHCDEFFYCPAGQFECDALPCHLYDEPETQCQQINPCFYCNYGSGQCEAAATCTYPDGDECCQGYTCETYGCELKIWCNAEFPECATGYECKLATGECEWQSCCTPPCGSGSFCNADCECESGCHETGETCDPFSTNTCCSGLICNPFWPFCT